ncbi:unnamed protein product [Schistocephalus solidus]|uniref:Helicase SKI2W n=1 Tax=Schistocephalus solidus TaxID=70667 RepID=A0A183SVJ2_SCHSO|nr:unnamed protein product [Schistocephalus solidus]
MEVGNIPSLETLSELCPNSFDPFSLEPLKTSAFLDSLIKAETDSCVPLSLPDLDIPLVKFDAKIGRDFETGDFLVDKSGSSIYYSCPTHLFGKEADTFADSSANSVLAEILEKLARKFPTDQSLSRSLLTDCLGDGGTGHTSSKLSTTDALEECLAIANKDTLSRFQIGRTISVDLLPESHEDSSTMEAPFALKQMDASTEELLQKRMRKPVEEVINYAVQGAASEKLPPLRELIADPAFTWPFELDTFQKQAILCLERNQSVLVAAHTSAGKTVVAEQTFGDDVGLLTGDIKVATKSSILVMTTEILHNMLCNAAESIRDLEIVIMDEVHYLNDKERGHVWEQLMIMLPRHVVLVLLSATVPNSIEFADWLGRVRGGMQIHVAATNKRPVPLEHFLYTGTDSQTRENVYLVVDKDSKFHLNGKFRTYLQWVSHFAFQLLKSGLLAYFPDSVFASSRQYKGRSLVHFGIECFILSKPPYCIVIANIFAFSGPSCLVFAVILIFYLFGSAKESLLKPKKIGKKANVTANSDEMGQPLVHKNFDATPPKEEVQKQKPRSEYTGGKVNTPGRRNYLQKGAKGPNRMEKSDTTVWVGLIQMLKERELMPVIAFCFSRARITNLVHALDSVDLLSKAEKNEVLVFLRAAIGGFLKGPDRQLAQVLLVRRLAMRGLAIHHAGMLPLLKEVVEILFQRGLVRVLFATETFAMGVNMPARCVVFTSIQKHDGTRKRLLTAGEFTQMAGRAGRRGLDSTGTVIIIANNIEPGIMPIEAQLTQMLLGKPTKLQSQFKITYSMILYLHRGNLQTPQELIRQSFMHASELRLELCWKRQLEQLRETVQSTTVHTQTASTTTTIPSSSKLHMQTPNSTDVPVASYDRVKCPAFPPDSHAASDAACVEGIAKYYLACSQWRQLVNTCCNLASDLPLPLLSRYLSPGRLILLQLSEATVSAATKGVGGGRWTLAGSKCVPNWITAGVILGVTKVAADPTDAAQGRCPIMDFLSLFDHPGVLHLPQLLLYKAAASEEGCFGGISPKVHLKILTWQLPPAPDVVPMLGTLEEEDILSDGESAPLAFAPFPPQLMPLYCPKSASEGQRQLVLLSDVPLTVVLGVCSTSCLPDNVSVQQATDFDEDLSREYHWFRQEQLAAEAGLVVRRRDKKADNEDRPKNSGSKQAASLESVSSYLHACMSEALTAWKSVEVSDVDCQPRGLLPTVPSQLQLWRQLGINDPDVDTLVLLNEELSLPRHMKPDVLAGFTPGRPIAPESCPNLVQHLALAHRTTRRRWAINRLVSRLSPDMDALFIDYEARVRILEELGFLDKDKRSGCLTLKGRAACELQQMEVLLAEVLFEGSLMQLPPADIAALLSCFVCETGLRQATGAMTSAAAGLERVTTGESADIRRLPEARVQVVDPTGSANSGERDPMADLTLPTVPDHLQAAVKGMLRRAEQSLSIAYMHAHLPAWCIPSPSLQLRAMQAEYRIIDPEADTRLNPILVSATYAWACGQPFSAIVNLTDLAEGHLLRGLQRLDELLRHVASACVRLGDQTLAARVTEAQVSVHRDIVCAPSLYVADEAVPALHKPVQED